jgi:hypothetical protein
MTPKRFIESVCNAVATLKEGTSVYLWIATNRPNQPGDDGSWSTWDPTILGSTLKVSGSMTIQQVRLSDSG